MREWTVETAMAASEDGAFVVADRSGTLMTLSLPEDPRDEEEKEASLWLFNHQNKEVKEWFEGLGSSFAQHPRVLVDEKENWDYALALLRRAEWPKIDSPNSVEVVLMNFAWWTACVERRGRRLAQYYVGLLSRMTTPGYPDSVFSEKEQRRGLASLGNAIALLDASFDMDPYVRGWAKAWARSAFCKVEVSPKTAAALINSDAPADVMAPWEAFSLIIPPGLCDPVRRLWCSRHPETGIVGLATAVEENGNAVATDPTARAPGSWTTKERHLMLENLVRGACIAIENGEAKPREKTESRKAPVQGEHLPVPERWCLAATLEVDLREHTTAQWRDSRAFIRHKNWWVVKGHYRNQACGPRLQMRKRLWVHPYAKGDPGAIGLLRRVRV